MDKRHLHALNYKIITYYVSMLKIWLVLLTNVLALTALTIYNAILKVFFSDITSLNNKLSNTLGDHNMLKSAKKTPAAATSTTPPEPSSFSHFPPSKKASPASAVKTTRSTIIELANSIAQKEPVSQEINPIATEQNISPLDSQDSTVLHLFKAKNGELAIRILLPNDSLTALDQRLLLTMRLINYFGVAPLDTKYVVPESPPI